MTNEFVLYSAIEKGFKGVRIAPTSARAARERIVWQIPYLAVDLDDPWPVGVSGKQSVAINTYISEHRGFKLPFFTRLEVHERMLSNTEHTSFPVQSPSITSCAVLLESLIVRLC